MQTTNTPNENQQQSYKLTDNFNNVIDSLNNEIEHLTEQTSDIVVDLINPKNVFDKHQVKVAKKFKLCIEELKDSGWKPPEIGVSGVRSLSASLKEQWLLPCSDGTQDTPQPIAQSTKLKLPAQSDTSPSTETK